MRVVVLWRDNTDYARTVIDWLRDFEHRSGKVPESLSPDEPEGESLARSYDVVNYPAILAIDNDGRMLQMWGDGDMPKMDDVMFYMLDQQLFIFLINYAMI